MHERLIGARRAVTGAPGDEIVERLAEQLAKEYQVTDVELYLVDYRLAALVPLSGGDPLTRPGDPAWRSFDHQSEVVTGADLYLPVTGRGERIGVLRLGSGPMSADQRAELAEFATVLAHEVQAARPGTDRYLVAARTRRLTLAAEMQWELLPGRCRFRPSFHLAGQLEPAYAVRGDSFDWAETGDRLLLSVMNGMGEGVAAAMLTTLGTQALRNARRAGLDLADQAALADQAVFSQYQGAQHLATLLLELDTVTGRVTAIDAGSPRLFLLRDGAVRRQELEPQFPLGMFDGSHYRPQHFDLRPGDRLVAVGDGVCDAVSTAGRYGDAALDRFLRRTGPMAPLEAIRSLLGDVRAFVSADLVDDAVAVCLDWTGPRR